MPLIKIKTLPIENNHSTENLLHPVLANSKSENKQFSKDRNEIKVSKFNTNSPDFLEEANEPLIEK